MSSEDKEARQGTGSSADMETVEETIDSRGGAGSLSERPGDVIGRYKLIKQIGEGGFGVVYLAQQEEPVKRQVALKVIKLGMDTRQVIARFEAERQALAMMDHPHIAKVLDAGATDTGRPYFVMELVDGVRITDFCNQQKLPFPERLRLFMEVCSAVQHAHQKGIIHRDIKPSNVLITRVDDRPVPKVIDFGIAKATEQRLTEQTMFTEFGQFLGTPAYMSPEQADPIGVDIDTRSDIYSLGVLLYELLTGVTPFDMRTLRSAALDEIKRIIREDEPPRPSTRLSSLGAELDAVARQRDVEPKKLTTFLRGDLDWIIMKALEKDRARRYETANALAMDIDRYLNNEPVTASPPSAAYRLKKLVRRNKGPFAIAAVFAFLLLGGITGTTIGLMRARRAEGVAKSEAQRALLAQAAEAEERDRAENEAERARTEAAKSAQVAEFMSRMLEGVGPSVARGRDTTMLREVLDRTAEQVRKELGDQPDVEASIQSTLGVTYLELSEYDRAEKALRRALELNRSQQGDDSVDVARMLGALGLLKQELDEWDEAERLFRDALAIQKRIAGDRDADTAWRGMDLANFLVGSKRIGEEPEALLLLALEVLREIHGDTHEDVAVGLNSLAILYHRRKDYESAESYYRKALQLHRDTLGADHPYVAIDMHNLADLLNDKGDLQTAEPLYRECLELSRKLYPDGDELIALILEALAGIRAAERGQMDRAIELYEETIALRRQLYGADHDSLGTPLWQVGQLYVQMRTYDAAEASFRELLRIKQQRYGDEHFDVSIAMQNLGNVLRLSGNEEEALSIHRQVVDMQRRLLGDAHHELATSLWHVGVTLTAMGDAERAAAVMRESLDILRTTLGDENETTINCMERYARALRELEKFTESEQVLREAIAVRERNGTLETKNGFGTAWELAQTLAKLGEREESDRLFDRVLSNPDVLGLFNVAMVRMNYAKLLRDASRFADAEVQTLAAYEIYIDPQTSSPTYAAIALDRMITLYEMWHAAEPDHGYDARAAEWREKLESYQSN